MSESVQEMPITEEDVYQGHEGEERVQASDQHNSPEFPMPDVHNTDSLLEFKRVLSNIQDRHGVKTLMVNIDTLLRHKGLFTRSAQVVEAGVQRLNGQRTEAQRAGDTKRTAGYAARRFYEGLSTDHLRAQAKIAGLNPAYYTSNEELINALIQWYNEQTAEHTPVEE